MKTENINVLVVDDFPVMHKIVKNTLSAKGFQAFFTAVNGLEALKVLQNHQIGLVITDWNMPQMDGLSLLKKIRQDKKLCHIPVLMITAETKKENIREAILYGINEFMIKPFKPQILYNKIESILMGKSPIQQKDLDLENDQDNVTNTLEALPIPKPFKPKDKAEILVVDDVPTNLNIIREFLKDTYKVRAATNGKKAIQIIESDTPPDIIMLDIMMPEMDGIEVCKHIKANPMVADIPVIFLTAKTDTESLVEAFDAGGVDYITKPVNKIELQARVNNHLQLKYSKDELRGQVDLLMSNARLHEDIERMSRHDLKTPVSAIIGLTENIRQHERFKNLPQDMSENINQAQSSAYLLLDMVNQSLNIHKIEMGKYSPCLEQINIKTIINKVAQDVSVVASELSINVTIEYDESPAICLIEELLCYSIFSNLIKNAVEASELNAFVTINLTLENDKVIVSIHNSTMVPQEIEHSFFNKQVTFGKQYGTGFGTYSAKLMTEVQNGTITMETSETEGTILKVAFTADH